MRESVGIREGWMGSSWFRWGSPNVIVINDGMQCGSFGMNALPSVRILSLTFQDHFKFANNGAHRVTPRLASLIWLLRWRPSCGIDNGVPRMALTVASIV